MDRPVLLAVDQEFSEHPVLASWSLVKLAELLADWEVRGTRRAPGVELYSRPVMSGDEVALLLETASRKTYTRRGTGSDSRS